MYTQHILRAMQTHGLIVADNGSDLCVTGTIDPRWNNEELNPAFRSLTAADSDVIALGWRWPSAAQANPAASFCSKVWTC